MLTAVKCECKEDNNINKHTLTHAAKGWTHGRMGGGEDEATAETEITTKCWHVPRLVGGKEVKLGLCGCPHTDTHTRPCGCQVPFHAQIECLSGLVGTSLSATSPPPRFATGSGNSAWECIRIRIRCVCRGVGKPSQHSSISRLETGDSRTELEAPTFHILAISKFRIGVYNSWRFTWRTKNYYLLSTRAASSSVCLCASQR